MISEYSNPSAPLLHLDTVVKAYGGRRVLDGISLALAAGERLALMGPSGSGKSTLLNCLGGIDRIDAGSLRFEGEELGRLDLDHLARMRRTKIGTIFQFFHLLPTMTAQENVEFVLQLKGMPTQERHQRAEALLVEVGLAERRHALPCELSGGEQQRVAIARALAGAPRLLLADEPTGNLDTQTGERILELLQTLCEQHQTALVMVTHNPEAVRICHRTLHLRDGRIHAG